MYRQPKAGNGKQQKKTEYSIRFEQPEGYQAEDPALAIWADGAKVKCDAMTCAESLKMTQQRIRDERTEPEVYWRGRKDGESLSHRIVKRGNDSWLQVWNATTAKQLFQPKASCLP